MEYRLTRIAHIVQENLVTIIFCNISSQNLPVPKSCPVLKINCAWFKVSFVWLITCIVVKICVLPYIVSALLHAMTYRLFSGYWRKTGVPRAFSLFHVVIAEVHLMYFVLMFTVCDNLTSVA
jgi:hypothetical protein